jgi:hypothetical protein
LVNFLKSWLTWLKILSWLVNFFKKLVVWLKILNWLVNFFKKLVVWFKNFDEVWLKILRWWCPFFWSWSKFDGMSKFGNNLKKLEFHVFWVIRKNGRFRWVLKSGHQKRGFFEKVKKSHFFGHFFGTS